MPSIVVAVPMAKNCNSLVVATATLRSFMIHDCVLHAHSLGRDFNPEEEDVEDVFSRYVLLDRADQKHPFWLAGVCALPLADILRARDAMGRESRSFVRPVETREWDRHGDIPLLESEDLVLGDLANALGIQLPVDANERVRNIVHKHAPTRFNKRQRLNSAVHRLSAAMQRAMPSYLAGSDDGGGMRV